MMNKKAFTLIELLVVVLIIGILAAVALPQYQTAVNKSRYAGLMPLAKSVKQAEEEMLMAQTHYTDQLEDLAIQVPGAFSADGKSITNEDGVKIEIYSKKQHDYVKASRANLPNTFVMYFDKSPTFAGEIHCEALKEGDGVNKRAKQLCESLGGEPLATQTGTDDNYVAYVLQGEGIGKGSGNLGYRVEDCSFAGNNCQRFIYDDGHKVEAWDEFWSPGVLMRHLISVYNSNGEPIWEAEEQASGTVILTKDHMAEGMDGRTSYEFDPNSGGYHINNEMMMDEDWGYVTTSNVDNWEPWTSNSIVVSRYIPNVGELHYDEQGLLRHAGVNGGSVYFDSLGNITDVQTSYMWLPETVTENAMAAYNQYGTNTSSSPKNKSELIAAYNNALAEYCDMDSAASFCQ